MLPSGTIATIVGTGATASSGDGGPATDASFTATWGTIAFDSSGALYFADGSAKTIRRVGSDGVATTVVGPASGAALVDPTGVAFGPDGDLYIADFGASRIWKVDPAGAISVFAGTGVSGSTGDGGPATSARINASGLAVGPHGDVYIDDTNRYRSIDSEGFIHAFAGTGVQGFSGDGGPAVEAKFSDQVSGIAVDASGNVYLNDPHNFRIRRVDPGGTITTVIGAAGEGYSGDGGPAADARIGTPHGLALGPEGDLYFSDDWDSSTVRRIDRSGIVTTVAGQASRGFAGDCGPGAAALLSQPSGVAVDNGVIYVVDTNNNRIRIVLP